MHFPEKITELDNRFYTAIRSKPFSSKAEKWLKLYVRLGDGWFWAVVTIWVFATHSRKELFAIVLPVLSAAAVALLLYFSIKLTVRRARPHVLLGIEAEVPPLDHYSFPSGHVMNNLAVAMALSWFFPAVGAVAIVVPITWGLLRVYYGVHYLSDVIAGIVLALISVALGFSLSFSLGWL